MTTAFTQILCFWHQLQYLTVSLSLSFFYLPLLCNWYKPILKEIHVAKHVQYCCRKLAFSIGIASSFTIGPLDSINRASSHLRRSTLGRTVRFSPSSRLADCAVVVCLCRFRWPGHHHSRVRPSSNLTPSLFRRSRVNSVDESGPASVSCCGVARGCEIFQDSMRAHEKETKQRDSEREDGSKRDLGGGGWNSVDRREKRDVPESCVRRVGGEWDDWGTVVQENKRYRFVAEGGSNRREGGLSTHWRKDTLVWNAKERNTRKREERTRESDRRRSDEDSPGVAGEEQHGMENEGETGWESVGWNERIGWTKKAPRPAREGREALRS